MNAAFILGTEGKEKRGVAQSGTYLCKYCFDCFDILYAFKPVNTPFHNIHMHVLILFGERDDFIFGFSYIGDTDSGNPCAKLQVSYLYCVHDNPPSICVLHCRRMPERDWSLRKHTACYVYILTKSSAGNKYKIRPELIVFMHSYGSSGSGFCGELRHMGKCEGGLSDFFVHKYLPYRIYFISIYEKGQGRGWILIIYTKIYRQGQTAKYTLE